MKYLTVIRINTYILAALPSNSGGDRTVKEVRGLTKTGQEAYCTYHSVHYTIIALPTCIDSHSDLHKGPQKQILG